MKSILKSLLILLISFTSTSLFAQDQDKTVSLVVSAQGKTLEEAKQNALRSAIEQAFGAFISSKTEVLNDSIVKEQIVSVSNGNIQSYDVISEVQTLDGGYASTLKAIVSISKLSTFCKSKGLDVDFNGELFAFNIQQQYLNEINEEKIIQNLFPIAKQILKNVFDYKLIVSEPVVLDQNLNNWKVPVNIILSANNNFYNFSSLLFKTINAISLDKNELISFHKLGKKIYNISYAIDKKTFGQFYLRNESSAINLIKIVFLIRDEIYKLKLTNGIDTFLVVNNPKLFDLKFSESLFRPLLTKGQDGEWCGICLQSLFNSVNSSCHKNYLYTPISVFSDIKKNNYDDLPRSFDGFQIGYDYEKSTNCFDLLDKESGFSFLRNFILKNKNGIIQTDFGLVLSFVNFLTNKPLLEMIFSDVRSISELKRIKKYSLVY